MNAAALTQIRSSDPASTSYFAHTPQSAPHERGGLVQLNSGLTLWIWKSGKGVWLAQKVMPSACDCRLSIHSDLETIASWQLACILVCALARTLMCQCGKKLWQCSSRWVGCVAAKKCMPICGSNFKMFQNLSQLEFLVTFTNSAWTACMRNYLWQCVISACQCMSSSA